MPSKLRSRVRPAAAAGVKAASMYSPSRERLLCSWVTLTCASIPGTTLHTMPARNEKVRIEDFIYTQSISPRYPSTTTRRRFVKDYRDRHQIRRQHCVSTARYSHGTVSPCRGQCDLRLEIARLLQEKSILFAGVVATALCRRAGRERNLRLDAARRLQS